ncbi:MAG: PilT/PilU family type 4a pilus ATPase [Pseudomonadota bacterium]
MKRFEELIALGASRGFSDLHIMGEHPLVFRKNGTIHFATDNRWSSEEINELGNSLLSPRDQKILKERLSVDFARTIKQVRVRLNIFYGVWGLTVAIRLLPGKVPSIENLNLHPSLQEFCKLSSGLILICGSTGCGKSTTIAALIEEINRTRPAHIISLENPIEYRFVSKKSLIAQRELGAHIPSFEQGLLDVLREDPDVIVVGELREPETIRLTLNAAESGHLVIASLHANNSEDAIYRICNAFPGEIQESVRGQLSSTLALLLVQQLVYLDKLGFRVPALSILRGTQSVKGLIRDNRLVQIESALQTGRGQGMFTMEQYKSEYLGTREHFTPPSFNFRPSAEIAAQVISKATPEVPMVHIKVEAPEPEVEKGVKTTYEYAEDSGKHYVIDGEESMDQVLQEIEKLSKF